MRAMRTALPRLLGLLALLAGLAALAPSGTAQQPGGAAYVLHIDGAIGPATRSGANLIRAASIAV